MAVENPFLVDRKSMGVSPDAHENDPVNLGQDFEMFGEYAAGSDSKEEGFRDTMNFRSLTYLRMTRMMPDIALTVQAIAGYKNATQAFTPFDPEKGYQITRGGSENGTPVKNGFSDIKRSPLLLGVTIHPEASTEGEVKRTPEELRIIEKLRFMVSFPNGLTFESRGQVHSLNLIDFSRGFYPADTCPLVSSEDYPTLDEGLQIALPSNSNQLQLVRGEFRLVG